MTKKLRFGFCLILFLTGVIFSEPLTLKEAIKMCLRHNYQIELSEKTIELSQANAPLGNANLLPQIDLSTSKSGSVSDSEYTYQGITVDNDDAYASSQSLSLSFSYNLLFCNNYRKIVT